MYVCVYESVFREMKYFFGYLCANYFANNAKEEKELAFWFVVCILDSMCVLIFVLGIRILVGKFVSIVEENRFLCLYCVGFCFAGQSY